MTRHSTVPVFLLALLGSTALADQQISFNRDIRPILSEYCFACHGPDANHREADLRLDDRDAAVDHGAIVPGKPDESTLVERVHSDDPDSVMPPPKGGKKLSDDQKKLLSDWIEQGSEYQKHWSFEPVPECVAIPKVHDNWPRNGIDHFVARSLKEKEFTRANEADRATWLRRVKFDLTGLPPSLNELDAFLNDESSDAYDTVVDRLLTSKTYGERMANMWLDVARYADTFGYQNDVAMEVWPWRDWVISAFNQNMPYDQFLTEQIAGDLLPNATQDQRLATTFNRLHRQTNEGGSVAEEFRITGINDRTTTAGTAFLGLTLECSRCHDHKFDPIKQSDFYRLSAYFSDIDEFGLYSHFTFSQPTPAMLLYQGDERKQHESAINELQQAQADYERMVRDATSRWKKHQDTLTSTLPEPRSPVVHIPLDGSADGMVGKATVCNGDDEIVCEGAPEFGRTSPFSFSLWVKPAANKPRMLVLHQSVAAEDSGFRGLQITIDDGHPEFSMIHFWPGNAVRIRSRDAIPTNEWTHVVITHDGSGKADGLRLLINGQLCEVDVKRDELTRDIRHRKEWGDMNVGKVKMALGARFRDIGFRDGLVDDLMVFDVQLSLAEVASLYHKIRPAAEPNSLDAEISLDHHLLTADETVRVSRDNLQSARQRENEVVTGVREIMVMRHFNGAPATHVLTRGEYAEKAERVDAGTPEFLSSIPIQGNDRLALARWMTDPRNPLTARVIVNRMWYLFFGRGIVVSLEDLGSQGNPPSHPELLDYLARSLMDEGWDLHSLCRQIVLSATYRQSSVASNPRDYERDPDNVWLARGPKHRLSAEQLRDATLSASGLLVNNVGGPSVMPYQPAGLWEEAGTGKSYQQSTGDGLYRRSLYTFWKRTSPPPSMITFDATSREGCTARRELTTTPLQALVFLNDTQFVEASRVLAERVIENHGDKIDGRWDELFRRLISRSPTDKELKILNDLYVEQLAYFEADLSRVDEFLNVGTRPISESLDRAQLAATSVVAQTVIAYDETIMLR
jgi:Protein of unknown function (DUF1553)/Protein of unknown function (DUF1549)/Planctomycete cytochrome C/Concanavalin A-like lectin/glucanases superfamily